MRVKVMSIKEMFTLLEQKRESCTASLDLMVGIIDTGKIAAHLDFD